MTTQPTRPPRVLPGEADLAAVQVGWASVQSRTTGPRYTMVVGPGGVALRATGLGVSGRTCDAQPEPPATAGWSRRSRARMVQAIAMCDLGPLFATGRPILLTLTLPGEWEALAPTAAAFRVVLRRFYARWARAISAPRAIWKLEFQRRGAVHVHLLIAAPTEVNGTPFREWVSRAWYEAVDSNDPRHLAAGTGVDWASGAYMTDAGRAVSYFVRHAAPGGSKGYQHEVPEHWRTNNDRFRFWGTWGLTRTTVELDLADRDDMVECCRLLRRAYRSQRRTKVVVVNTVDPETGEILRVRRMRRRVVLRAFGPNHRRPDHIDPGDWQPDLVGGFLLVAHGPALAAALGRYLATRLEEPAAISVPT